MFVRVLQRANESSASRVPFLIYLKSSTLRVLYFLFRKLCRCPRIFEATLPFLRRRLRVLPLEPDLSSRCLFSGRPPPPRVLVGRSISWLGAFRQAACGSGGSSRSRPNPGRRVGGFFSVVFQFCSHTLFVSLVNNFLRRCRIKGEGELIRPLLDVGHTPSPLLFLRLGAIAPAPSVEGGRR